MGSSGGSIPEGDKGSVGPPGPPATLGEWKALKLEEGITNIVNRIVMRSALKIL
jgi:hypothetical protein